MQIHITPRNLTLTGAIYEFVAEKVSHLEGHGEQLIAAHIVLLHNHDRKKPYCVKVHLALAGPDIHAEDAEADLYVAIDKVVDKLSRQISKLKTRKKITTNTARNRSAKRSSAVSRGLNAPWKTTRSSLRF